MLSREAEEEKEETLVQKRIRGFEQNDSSAESPACPPAACEENQSSTSSQKDEPQVSSGHTGLSETTEHNGDFTNQQSNIICRET